MRTLITRLASLLSCLGCSLLFLPFFALASVACLAAALDTDDEMEDCA